MTNETKCVNDISRPNRETKRTNIKSYDSQNPMKHKKRQTKTANDQNRAFKSEFNFCTVLTMFPYNELSVGRPVGQF